MNQPFGNDASLGELCERIRGFNYTEASPAELSTFLGAVKLVAQDTVDRNERIRKMELELRNRITEAELYEELRGVVDITQLGKLPRVSVVKKIRRWWTGE